MSHCLCGSCEECKERIGDIARLVKEAEDFGKKHDVSPLSYLKVLEKVRKDKE